PDATFQTAQKAVQRDDFRTFFQCWKPASQEHWFVTVFSMALFRDGFFKDSPLQTKRKLFKDLNDLLVKHDLDSDAQDRLRRETLPARNDDKAAATRKFRFLATSVKDRIGFFAAAVPLLPNKRVGDRDAAIGRGTLRDV